MPTIVAIDFETADHGRDSACAIGLARLSGGVTTTAAHLIRPPRSSFVFTHIHKICWDDVKRERTFGELWERLQPFIRGADFFAAHNASFDRAVLSACCAVAGVAVPASPFLCTVRLARAAWNIRPTTLPDVCRHLGIPLDHHDAGSDARACAAIIAAAIKNGVDIERAQLDKYLPGTTSSAVRAKGAPRHTAVARQERQERQELPIDYAREYPHARVISRDYATAKVLVACPMCKGHARLPANRTGPVRCPLCSARFFAATV
jgi:DNA polymerase III subunit epsilon